LTGTIYGFGFIPKPASQTTLVCMRNSYSKETLPPFCAGGIFTTTMGSPTKRAEAEIEKGKEGEEERKGEEERGWGSIKGRFTFAN